MSVESSAVLRIRPGLVVETFVDATLIWDDDRANLHHLDAIASVVWQELDGRRQLGEIARCLAEEFAAPPDMVRRDVLTVAGRWVDEGLVTIT